MKYLIIDDEPIAHQIIEKFAVNLPFLKLQANCYHAVEALTWLADHPVDLIFLDIEMPQLKGFDFLRTLAHRPQIIVVSAHKEFALESYEFNVCDYLLKPFNFERFVRAVNKARASQSGIENKTPPERHETLFLKDGKKHHQVRLAEIEVIEACGNYSMVHLQETKILTQEKISDLAERLSGVMVRVHKSYLVATTKISLIEAEELHIGGRRIPIGRAYKSNIAKLLGQ